MGSLHCAGMCGPLILLTPVVGNMPSSILASRALYHLGRITTYTVIGLIFGLIGQSIILAGFQRWLSFIVGILMLTLLLLAIPLKSQLTRIPFSIKSLFAKFLRQRSYTSIFALGAANGLLPCGLVYMAATASIATGNIPQAAAYMTLFGIGTLPTLLAISFAGEHFNLRRFPALQKLGPVCAALVAVLLIARAQPKTLFAPQETVSCPACHSTR
jgi:sulfite exporter TauE/SafE